MYCLFQSPHKDVTYTATGDSRAMLYFSVNSQTGVVSVSKPLHEDTNNADYNVSKTKACV
jgi:hypothetical protein